MTERKWSNGIAGYKYRIICDKCGKVHPDEFYNNAFAQQEILARGWVSSYKPAICDYVHVCPACYKEANRK